MIVVMTDQHGNIHIPATVRDLDTFRAWYHSGRLPEKLSVHFLRGGVWIDLHPERAFSHNLIRAALTGALSRAEGEGRVFGRGLLFTNDAAGFATLPDAVFITDAALAAGRVRFAGTGDAELVGKPDMVAEVVSDSTEAKDTRWLKSAYFAAGVPEYWLVDARSGPPQLSIYRRRRSRYEAVRKTGGWVRSAVFGRAFRFIPGRPAFEQPTYDLEAR